MLGRHMESRMLYALLLVIGLLQGPAAHAQEQPEVRGPIEAAGDAIKEKKSEKELAREARLAEIEAANAERAARVVVLKWPETDVDHTNEALQRNIRVRISRPSAKFYPSIDLYQAGRKEPDPSVRPVDQRAVVPDIAIDRVLQAVEDTATIPWNALSPQDWGLKAAELRELSNEIWFVDRPELREPLFLLYAQIGRAADNRNDSAPPFFEQVGSEPVNYYWYLAGAMAHDDPALMSKLTDQDIHASIGYYKDMVDRGQIPPMTLSFELSGEWDPKAFANEYQVFINGLEVVIADDKGLWRTAPGRVDVYLSRDDGHSLSDRIELDKLNEKIYGVLDGARKRMGLQFREQLMEHPNECIPELDGDILNYLAIYAKLHPNAEIYIAVPEGGSVASNKIHLWRWVRERGILMNVGGGSDFPVRFAFLLGAGLDFNNATYTPPTAEEIADDAAKANPQDPTAGVDAVQRTLDQLPELTPAGVPFHFHLRGHYGRLLVTTGLEFSLRTEGVWASAYQTDTVIKDANGVRKEDDDHRLVVEETVPVQPVDENGNPTIDCQANPDDPQCNAVVEVDLARERKFQRLVFLGTGVVMGPNAAIGFGPRLLLRTGWYNTPHAVDLTGHAGWSAQAPFSKKATGRVRPLVDVNLYGGAMIPFRDSLVVFGNNAAGVPKRLGQPYVRFGFQVSAGLTF